MAFIFRFFNKSLNAFRYLLKLPPPWVSANIFNRSFRVRGQTIRVTPDKDDAWVFACSYISRQIFDIGSNIGQSAMLELFPDTVEHVLLVDPNPMALSIAAENLIVNGLISRVNFECVFISDQSGNQLDFYTVLYGAAGSMYQTHAVTAAKKNSHFKVPTLTIDDLVNKYGIPDFIKIDIEGAESLALKGSFNCMSKRKTRFLVEMHSNPDLPMFENARRILETCSKVDYKAWYLSRQLELVDPQLLSDRGRCHLLIQPMEWEWPQTILKIKQNSPLDKSLYDSIIKCG
jgi:FkbM family methyltransferase